MLVFVSQIIYVEKLNSNHDEKVSLTHYNTTILMIFNLFVLLCCMSCSLIINYFNKYVLFCFLLYKAV